MNMPLPAETTETGERPIRVRLTKRQARIYRQFLADGRHELVINRAKDREAGNAKQVTLANRVIEEVGRMQEELLRSMDERGWD